MQSAKRYLWSLPKRITENLVWRTFSIVGTKVQEEQFPTYQLNTQWTKDGRWRKEDPWRKQRCLQSPVEYMEAVTSINRCNLSLALHRNAAALFSLQPWWEVSKKMFQFNMMFLWTAGVQVSCRVTAITFCHFYQSQRLSNMTLNRGRYFFWLSKIISCYKKVYFTITIILLIENEYY